MSENPRKLGALGFSGRESENSRIGKCKSNSITVECDEPRPPQVPQGSGGEAESPRVFLYTIQRV